MERKSKAPARFTGQGDDTEGDGEKDGEDDAGDDDAIAPADGATATRPTVVVEIARLNYVAPRMRESPGGRERQAGRGAGESALELDRRKIRDRIAELREQLRAIEEERGQRRHARRDQPRVALVGYTNAGKSSLMRALTGSDVLVADKLFATLVRCIPRRGPASSSPTRSASSRSCHTIWSPRSARRSTKRWRRRCRSTWSMPPIRQPRRSSR